MARQGCKNNKQITHEIPDIKGFKIYLTYVYSTYHIDEIRALSANQSVDVLALNET